MTDIYHNQKQQCGLKSCSIVLSDCKNDVPECQSDKQVSLYQKPLGLTNPSNHCYLNSVLQIVIHLLKTNYWDRFNDSVEGDIIRKILHISSLSTLPRTSIMELKNCLKSYNALLSGSRQQDACECFLTLMDIIHKGTKYSLVPGIDDDDNAISLTNSMFMSIYEKVFTCRVCGGSMSCHWQSRMLYIFPVDNCSIEEMVKNNMSQVVHKTCIVCHRNTEHNEILQWVCPAKYLVLAVNRFAYVGGRTIKSKSLVPIQTRVSMDGHCFTLVGIIHHHGDSANSGHYTCTLFHNDNVFQCNDMMITESSGFEFVHSATSYILVYRNI